MEEISITVSNHSCLASSLSSFISLFETLKYVIGMENVIRKSSANLDKFKKTDINEKIKTDQVRKN